MYLPFNGDDVYEDEVKGLVSSLFQGINATVFAYGETNRSRWLGINWLRQESAASVYSK